MAAMYADGADFTNTFRALSSVEAGTSDQVQHSNCIARGQRMFKHMKRRRSCADGRPHYINCFP